MHMDPAQYVVSVFGGVCALARAIGKTPGRVSHWRRTGRIASDDVKRRVLAVARERGLDLTADDLLDGREVDTAKTTMGKAPTGAH